MSGCILSIEVGDNTLVFYDKTTIKFLLKSGFFTNDVEMPSRSYEFKIPSKPNTLFLNFPDGEDNRTAIHKQACRLKIDREFWKNGVLYVTETHEDYYKIKVVIDNGTFVDFTKKTLQDFAYNKPTPYRYWKPFLFNFRIPVSFRLGYPPSSGPDIFLRVTIEALAEPSKLNRTYDFVYTPGQSREEHLENIAKTINVNYEHDELYAESDGTGVRLYWLYNNDGAVSVNTDDHIGDYYTIFHDVDTTITAIGNNDHWEGYRRLADDTVNNPEDYDFIFFPVKNKEIFGSKWDYINQWNLYLAKFQELDIPLTTLYPLRSNVLSPYAYVNRVFKSIHEESDIQIIESIIDSDADLRKLVFFHTNAIISNVEELRGWSNTFKYKDILPNITIAELLADIRSLLCAVYEYNSRDNTIRLYSRNKILDSTEFDDWSDKTLYGRTLRPNVDEIYGLAYTWNDELSNTRILADDSIIEKEPVNMPTDLPALEGYFKMRLVKFRNHYYIHTDSSAINYWDFYKEMLQSFGDKFTTTFITTGISPSFEIEELMLNDRLDANPASYTDNYVKWLIPYSLATVARIKTEDITHRYVFYYGMQPGLIASFASVPKRGEDFDPETLTYLPTNYPFASYHTHNYAGDRVGNTSLAWNGEDGLVNKHWSKFLNVLKNPSFRFESTLSKTDLMNLDLLKKKKRGNQYYLIDELEVQFSNVIEVSQSTEYIIKFIPNE
jgi:hypothetical protein